MLTTRTPAAPVLPSTGRLRPLGIDEVRITGGFWAERQRTNAATTLPHIAHWQESEGWMGNFDLAASGQLPQGRRGREFSDSEIYKFLEAVAWELGRCPDPDLEELFRGRVARIAAACLGLVSSFGLTESVHSRATAWNAAAGNCRSGRRNTACSNSSWNIPAASFRAGSCSTRSGARAAR